VRVESGHNERVTFKCGSTSRGIHMNSEHWRFLLVVKFELFHIWFGFLREAILCKGDKITGCRSIKSKMFMSEFGNMDRSS